MRIFRSAILKNQSLFPRKRRGKRGMIPRVRVFLTSLAWKSPAFKPYSAQVLRAHRALHKGARRSQRSVGYVPRHSFRQIRTGKDLLPRVPRAWFIARGALSVGCSLVCSWLASVQDAWKRFAAAGEDWIIDSEDRAGRLSYISSVFGLFAMIIVARLAVIKGFQSERWIELAERQHEGVVEIEGARGTIVDRFGRTLAASVETVSLGVHHRKVRNREELAEALSPIIGLPLDEILGILSRDRSFSWLKRGLDLTVADRVLELRGQGVSVFKEFRRVYPQGKLAGSLLGRVGRDHRGQSGVELRFDRKLLAPKLSVAVRRDAFGRLLASEESKIANHLGGDDGTQLLRAAFPSSVAELFSQAQGRGESAARYGLASRQEGNGIVLSIDSAIQLILEEELELSQRESGARLSFGVMLDASSGEVIAMAHFPQSLDPNQLEDVSPEDLRIPEIQDSFEPGSTLKPIVAAAAIELGLVNIQEILNCENGRYRFGDRIIRDVHPSGTLPVRDVLIRSSNICMGKIGERLGRERLYKALRDFGLGRRTDIELPGEAGGILRPVSSWAQVDTATHSFGQGVAMTALQLVRAYGVFANGGYLVQPTLLSREKGTSRRRLISEKTAAEVRSALRGVVEDSEGTGRRAAITGIPVYGKTGTAQKPRPDGRGYDPDRMLSSFIGFTGEGESFVGRSIILGVFVDEPATEVKYGGVIAAPVFKRVMSRTIAYLMRADLSTGQRAEATTSNGVRQIDVS